MDGTRPKPSAGGDRLSKLEDRVLGHVLSFLPANEAARAALLSSRWRGVFAAVHTLSLEEPEPPMEECDDRYDIDSWNRGPPPDPNAPPHFHCTVSNALLARGGAAPLRALRVDMQDALETASDPGVHPSTVDQWVSYAVQHAAPEGLRLDLRLGRVPLCHCPYSLRDRSGGRPNQLDADDKDNRRSRSPPLDASRRRRRASESDDEQPRTRRRRSISSNEGSSASTTRSRSPLSSSTDDTLRDRFGGRPKQPDADDEDDRRSMSVGNRAEESPPPDASRRRRRASSDMGSESDDEHPRTRRRRSISSNEGSLDFDSFRDRALSPRQRLASASSRPSNDLSSSSDDTLFCPPSPPLRPPLRRYDEEAARPDHRLRTVSTVLFSCTALRSLSLGHFLLTPPAKVNLPSLETLLLSHVSDPGGRVERIIAGSPRLADLTLEACSGVGMATLHVPRGARLRRLALRCCHGLAAVALDASELVAFEYRGAVPSSTFLSMHGGGGVQPNFAYLKVDICGAEVSEEEELTRLRELLLLFQNAKRLHLESARLGSGMGKDVLPVPFPTLPDLRHLELRGRLPDDDTAVVGAVSRILGHTPNLQALSLVFHSEAHDRWAEPCRYYTYYNEAELLDAHRLKYLGQSVHAPAASSMIACLRSSVREINLVHYQGVRTQRALAKFLLCNAPAIDRLWCELAEGPLWTQTQLMREIKGWVINKSASTHFL